MEAGKRSPSRVTPGAWRYAGEPRPRHTGPPGLRADVGVRGSSASRTAPPGLSLRRAGGCLCDRPPPPQRLPVRFWLRTGNTLLLAASPSVGTFPFYVHFPPDGRMMGKAELEHGISVQGEGGAQWQNVELQGLSLALC